MTQQPLHVVVIGAGCTGLAVSHALQKSADFKVTLIEKKETVGGLASGTTIGKNTYEYGPHIFHTDDDEVKAEVLRLAGDKIFPFDKTIKIKFRGEYFTYPLKIKDILLKLPPSTVIQAGLSFLGQQVLGLFSPESKLKNSEDVLIRSYGRVLYGIFFENYITKVWGMTAKDLSPSFARQRIPRMKVMDWFDVILKRLSFKSEEKKNTKNYVERVTGENYTSEHGFSPISDSFSREFLKNGGTLLCSTSVTAVHCHDNHVRSVSFINNGEARTLECDHLISTVPLNMIPKMMQPQFSSEVMEAAHKISFQGIVFIGLLVKKKDVLPASFMYFRDKIFNRIMDVGQFCITVDPPDATILIAEITCNPNSKYWLNSDDSAAQVQRELVEEGLIQNDDVLERHVFKQEFAYPIYSLGYEENIATLQQSFSEIKNFKSIGRQGEFLYINTHIAMKLGFDYAKEMIRSRINF